MSVDGGPEQPGASTIPFSSLSFNTTTQPRVDAPAFMWMLLGLAIHFCWFFGSGTAGAAVVTGMCGTNRVVGVAVCPCPAFDVDPEPPGDFDDDEPDEPGECDPLFDGDCDDPDDPLPLAAAPPLFDDPIWAPLPSPALAAAWSECVDPPVKCTMPKIASRDHHHHAEPDRECLVRLLARVGEKVRDRTPPRSARSLAHDLLT